MAFQPEVKGKLSRLIRKDVVYEHRKCIKASIRKTSHIHDWARWQAEG